MYVIPKIYINDKCLESVKRKYGFQFTSCKLHVLDGGWIVVCFRWKTQKDEFKFKFCKEAGMTSSQSILSQTLEFEGLRKNKPYKSHFELGIKLGTTAYKLQFWENIRYGVSVYFSPNSFGRIIDTFDEGVI